MLVCCEEVRQIKMTKTFCDLCGHEITASIGGFQLVRDRRQHIMPAIVDVCELCHDKIWDCATELKTKRKELHFPIDKSTTHR